MPGSVTPLMSGRSESSFLTVPIGTWPLTT